MGVIKRESFRQSIVNYLATGIGAISILFVYPLDSTAYGLALFLTSTAAFLYPFASLGITAISIRFFPEFEAPEKGHRGFFLFLVLTALFNFLLFLLFSLIIRGPALKGLALLSFDIALILTYAVPIYFLCFLTVLNILLGNYISNFGKITIPGIFTSLLPKLALPVLVLLIYYEVIDTRLFVRCILGYHLLITLGLAAYLARLGQLSLRLPALPGPGSLREIGSFGLYSMLSSVGSVFAFRIDHIMISALLQLSSTGLYGIAQFIGNSIEMPTRSVFGIASPVIAKAWAQDDREQIREIYRKASSNLFFIGTLVFLLIWLSLDDLFQLTPRYDELIQTRMIVFYVGISKLVDMATSVNGQIITYSRYYRFNLYAVLLLGALNVVLNLWLIPRIGFTGAAIATLCSIALFNLVKAVFVYYRFGMHPFSRDLGSTLLLALLSGLLLWHLPATPYPLLNILINSIAVCLIYLVAAWKFNLTPEVNGLLRQGWEKTGWK